MLLRHVAVNAIGVIGTDNHLHPPNSRHSPNAVHQDRVGWNGGVVPGKDGLCSLSVVSALVAGTSPGELVSAARSNGAKSTHHFQRKWAPRCSHMHVQLSPAKR